MLSAIVLIVLVAVSLGSAVILAVTAAKHCVDPDAAEYRSTQQQLARSQKFIAQGKIELPRGERMRDKR